MSRTEKPPSHESADLAANPQPPTHVSGAEVTAVTDKDANGFCDVVCKDGKQYTWDSKTGAVAKK